MHECCTGQQPLVGKQVSETQVLASSTRHTTRVVTLFPSKSRKLVGKVDSLSYAFTRMFYSYSFESFQKQMMEKRLISVPPLGCRRCLRSAFEWLFCLLIPSGALLLWCVCDAFPFWKAGEFCCAESKTHSSCFRCPGCTGIWGCGISGS